MARCGASTCSGACLPTDRDGRRVCARVVGHATVRPRTGRAERPGCAAGSRPSRRFRADAPRLGPHTGERDHDWQRGLGWERGTRRRARRGHRLGVRPRVSIYSAARRDIRRMCECGGDQRCIQRAIGRGILRARGNPRIPLGCVVLPGCRGQRGGRGRLAHGVRESSRVSHPGAVRLRVGR